MTIQLPVVHWVLQDSAIDPSGSRHLESPVAGAIKLLNTSAGGVLDFGSVNTAISGQVSDTKLAYARAASMGDVSGIFNMRLYWSSISAWGAGNYRFLGRTSLHFMQNLILSQNDNDIPTVFPSVANYSGTAQIPLWALGTPWVSGIKDGDAGMYQYFAVFVGQDVPVGTRGGAGAGSFRTRLVYDFS